MTDDQAVAPAALNRITGMLARRYSAQPTQRDLDVANIAAAAERERILNRDHLATALSRIELRPVNGKIAAEHMADALIEVIGEELTDAPGPGERATPEQMLREFHEAAGQVGGGFGSAELRQRMLDSEVQELRDALATGDLVETADALADIVYVAVGTAVQLGIPFDAVLAEVHRSNMTKLIPPILTRPDGKIIKGPQYEPPRIADLLDGDPDGK